MLRRPYQYRAPYHQQANLDYDYYYNQTGQQQYDYYDVPPKNVGQYQTPFEHYSKPNQPEYWPEYMQQNSSYYSQPNQPNQSNQSNQSNQDNYQNSTFNQAQTSSFLAQFQDGNGQVDFNKMLSTVGQLANTVQQVSPVIQQVGSMIKSFRSTP